MTITYIPFLTYVFYRLEHVQEYTRALEESSDEEEEEDEMPMTLKQGMDSGDSDKMSVSKLI